MGQSGHQIAGTFLTHALQACEQGGVEAVKVGDRAHKAALDKLFNQLAAEAIHIQCALAHPVAQGAAQDGRATAVHTTCGSLSAFAHEIRSAGWAVLRQFQGQGTLRTQFGENPQHFRNDLPCLAHDDGVAAVQVKLLEPIRVVQGCATDARASQGNWLEFGNGRYHPGAAHLTGEFEQAAGRFLRGVLESDGPARRFLGEASSVLQAQVIEFHHNPVGGVVEIVAPAVPVAEKLLNGVNVWEQGGVGVHAEACILQPAQAFPLAGGAFPRPVLGQMKGVSKEVEASCGHHLRVQLTQGSGAGIAGIGEQGLVASGPFPIDGGKGAVGDQGFASHLHPGGWGVEVQAQGNGGDGAHVGRDLFSLIAVTTGRCAHQHAVVVAQR